MDKRIYDFKVIIEPDEDRWFAHCPSLKDYGASTWGKTYEEAYRNIHEVIQMVIHELVEDSIISIRALCRKIKILRCLFLSMP